MLKYLGVTQVFTGFVRWYVWCFCWCRRKHTAWKVQNFLDRVATQDQGHKNINCLATFLCAHFTLKSIFQDWHRPLYRNPYRLGVYKPLKQRNGLMTISYSETTTSDRPVQHVGFETGSILQQPSHWLTFCCGNFIQGLNPQKQFISTKRTNQLELRSRTSSLGLPFHIFDIRNPSWNSAYLNNSKGQMFRTNSCGHGQRCGFSMEDFFFCRSQVGLVGWAGWVVGWLGCDGSNPRIKDCKIHVWFGVPYE